MLTEWKKAVKRYQSTSSSQFPLSNMSLRNGTGGTLEVKAKSEGPSKQLKLSSQIELPVCQSERICKIHNSNNLQGGIADTGVGVQCSSVKHCLYKHDPHGEVIRKNPYLHA